MKTLELNQMERVSGGDMDQRNCMAAGAIIVLGVVAACFSFGVGLGIAAGGAGVAANGNCF